MSSTINRRLETIIIILIGKVSRTGGTILLIYFLLRYHRPNLVSIVKRVAYSDLMKLVTIFSTVRNHKNKNIVNIDYGYYNSAVVEL